MRRTDFSRMTVVEQIITIREDICNYACKYREYVAANNKDPLVQRIKLQEYCKDCPLIKLHFNGVV